MCVCVCVVLYAEGLANAGESPGLSCCCTYSPREILTFPAQPTFSPAFLSGGSLQVTVTRWDLEQQSWGRKESGPPAFLRSPPLPMSPSISSVIPSACWRWGRGTYSVGAHVIWLESQASRQYVQSHPVTLLLSMKRLYTL